MKKILLALVLLALVASGLLIMRARTKASDGTNPNVVLDRPGKAGDIVATNGNFRQRLQQVIVRGTNVPSGTNEVPK
jgi:hypothetical protein